MTTRYILEKLNSMCTVLSKHAPSKTTKKSLVYRQRKGPEKINRNKNKCLI